MPPPVCLVTGASSGIGLATAIALARLNATVVGVGRTPQTAGRAAGQISAAAPGAQVEVLAADLADPEQVRSLAAAVQHRHERLDVLVNNAGATFRRRELTPAGVEKTLAVNHVAPFLLTHLLLGELRRAAPSRVVNVASSMHEAGRLDFDDVQLRSDYRQFRAYARSKLANVLFTYELARRLAGTGVTANAVHPGLVRTQLGARNGLARRLAWDLIHLRYRSESIDAGTGAAAVVRAATAPELEGVTGTYFSGTVPAQSSPASRDPALAARLWEYSERIAGLTPAANASR